MGSLFSTNSPRNLRTDMIYVRQPTEFSEIYDSSQNEKLTKMSPTPCQCVHCPQPCQLCSNPCFQGKCYECFPERVISCQNCGEMVWDGICVCEIEEIDEENEEQN